MGMLPHGVVHSAAGRQGPVNRWVVVPVTALVWLAAGASVTHWVMRSLAQETTTQVPMVPSAVMSIDTQRVASALGAHAMVQPAVSPVPVQADAASKYAVLGVVAPAGGGPSVSGVALISVEGQRPSPYRVGAVLDECWVVRSVGRATVELVPAGPAASASSGTAGLTLVVPQRSMASTGS